jgi:uncharacterized cysteine cluster protein YcgN (CxxCxxCC family)
MANFNDPNLCAKCGVCCYLSMGDDNGTFFYTPFFCIQLNCASCECKVYSERKKVVPSCMSVERAAYGRVLPSRCPYVGDDENYVGPRPDYRASPTVVRKVEELLKRGISGVYAFKGFDLRFDHNWTPEKTTYPRKDVKWLSHLHSTG